MKITVENTRIWKNFWEGERTYGDFGKVLKFSSNEISICKSLVRERLKVGIKGFLDGLYNLSFFLLERRL